MPGPTRIDPRLFSAEEILYREYGGPPPRLSAAATAARPIHRRAEAQASALADPEAHVRVAAAGVAILSALLTVADFALSAISEEIWRVVGL